MADVVVGQTQLLVSFMCEPVCAGASIFPSKKVRFPSSICNFFGSRAGLKTTTMASTLPQAHAHAHAQMDMNFHLGKTRKWWDKGLQTNMKVITSAEDLADSLLNAGDKLVVVDFFSPGCGGCKALHPKICQFAEANPTVSFLQVNYEDHKSMCYSLNVHVLPFFRFYRGAHGRMCSFSCTNATIKKFKDAMAKHNTDRCSLGPAKGLEEKELLALSANKDLNFTYIPNNPLDKEEHHQQEQQQLHSLPYPSFPLQTSPPTNEPKSYFTTSWR